MHDIVIRGGTIIDGAGTASFTATWQSKVSVS
jgi:N-acyl-D-aspartate/D-glutamate deacylase